MSALRMAGILGRAIQVREARTTDDIRLTVGDRLISWGSGEALDGDLKGITLSPDQARDLAAALLALADEVER